MARTRHRPRHSLRWLAVGAVAFLAFFYYRPLHAYFDTRHALQERRTEVRGLQAEKRRLQKQLAATTTPAALDLEARQLALVKPGERLFIVKGIAAWQRRHGGSIRRGG